MSIESRDNKTLFSLLRLRIPEKTCGLKILKNSALVREMHTYGHQLLLGKKSSEAAQHRGFGKQLLREAEKIANKEFGLTKIAVISGVGVRNYFRKQGYRLSDTYMIKKID